MKKKSDLELFVENYLDKELMGEMIDFATPGEEYALSQSNEIKKQVEKHGSATISYAFKFKDDEAEDIDLTIALLKKDGYKVKEGLTRLGTKKFTVSK